MAPLVRWLPIVIALLAHGAAVSGGFVADDMPDIVAHPVVSGEAAPWQVHEYTYMGEPIGQGINTVRPLTTLLFAAEFAAWGARPALFHLVSVLLFCAVVLAGQRYAETLVGERAALVAAALFASLAIHVDAVGMIANNAEVLSLGLAFAALLAASRGRAGLAAAACAGALLAKESAIALPVVAAVELWFMTERGSPERRRGARALAALLGTTALFLLARAALLDFDVAGNIVAADNPLLGAPVAVRLWMPFVLLGKYLATTVAPLSLSFDHSYNQVPAAVDLADPLGWLGLAAAGALIAAAAVALRRKSAVPLVVIAGFAASYALFSNTAFLIVTIFAERLFLAPSWWLCLGAVVAARWLLAREPSVRPALVALCAVVVVSQVALAALRSREIGSSADLLAAQVDTAPDSVKGHLYYARELASQRQAEEAVWQVAIAYAGQRAFPRPWRAPRDVDRLPVRERLARLPQLVAPDMAPRDYWSLLRPVARRFVGRQSLPIIDDLAGRSRE